LECPSGAEDSSDWGNDVVSTAQHQKLVMVVEDDPAIRSLLSMTLEAENYRVEVAEDGHEALSKLEWMRPDVLLLDLMLPKLDGWEVIEALRANSRTRGLPIIAISAKYGLLSAMDHGVQGYLPKPFDTEVMLTIIDEVLRFEPYSTVH
jgi:CheY-like chemotaxis protein